MPRRPRQEIPGGIFHVTARGNAATAIFLDDNDRLSFLNLVDRAQQRLGWILHAYCLLDTHVHLLVETPEPNLGRGMQGVLGGYAAFFNRRHQRFGHLFGERYHAVEVGSETYLVQAVVYVLLNPLRAGIVRHPRAWPWSSYRRLFDQWDAVGPPVSDLVLACIDPDGDVARRRLARLVDEAVLAHRGQAKA